jgi:hypothetical protein
MDPLGASLSAPNALANAELAGLMPTALITQSPSSFLPLLVVSVAGPGVSPRPPQSARTAWCSVILGWCAIEAKAPFCVPALSTTGATAPAGFEKELEEATAFLPAEPSSKYPTVAHLRCARYIPAPRRGLSAIQLSTCSRLHSCAPKCGRSWSLGPPARPAESAGTAISTPLRLAVRPALEARGVREKDNDKS